MGHKGLSVQSRAPCPSQGQRFSLFFLRDLEVRRLQGERAGRLQGRIWYVEGGPLPGGVCLLPSEDLRLPRRLQTSPSPGAALSLIHQGITAGLHT